MKKKLIERINFEAIDTIGDQQLNVLIGGMAPLWIELLVDFILSGGVNGSCDKNSNGVCDNDHCAIS